MALPPELELWRRFDDKDPAACDTIVRDEGNGEIRLKGWALQFHEDGLSLFRGDVLAALGLEPTAIVQEPYLALACATRQRIEAFATEYSAPPRARAFEVREDPLSPPPTHNPAHAIVVHLADYPTKSKRRKAVNELARHVFVYRTA